MVFVESCAFTDDVAKLLSEESYAKLQAFLMANPDAGDVIQGAGGLRKLRWSLEGTGKRGGARVIYFHSVARAQVRMLLIYSKGTRADLTSFQRARLRKINEGWT